MYIRLDQATEMREACRGVAVRLVQDLWHVVNDAQPPESAGAGGRTD